MRKITFSQVPVAGFFKETPDGVWVLKDSATTGLWHASGVKASSPFKATEAVWVD